MWKKLVRYGLLSLCSFCFFSALLRTVAHAQIPVVAISPAATTAPIRPTPIASVTPLPTAVLRQPDDQKITLQTDEKITLQTENIPDTTPTEKPSDAETPLTTPTIIPTDTPPTPTTTEPTVIPTSVPTVAPTVQTAPAQPVPGSLDAEKLFGMVNAHRQAIGLAPLQKDEKTCSLAAARAPEIAAEMAAGRLHSGMYGRNLPYWNTENAIAMGPEEAAFNWWMNEPIHRAAIDSKAHTISCVACTGVYCVEEFTSYIPK